MSYVRDTSLEQAKYYHLCVGSCGYFMLIAIYD